MRYLYDTADVPSRVCVSDTGPGRRPSPNHATALRCELSQRNRAWARDHALPHEITRGPNPAVLYREDEAGRHGNFFAPAYRAIKQRPDWIRRLAKAHTTTRRALLHDDQQSRRPGRSELDSSNSSDALLMNIFCHPATLASRNVRLLLGIDADEPVFGYKPRIPLRAEGRIDCTEIDLKLGDLLVEAKLTEYDFQWAPRRLIDRYRDLEEVFEASAFAESIPAPSSLETADLRYVDLDDLEALDGRPDRPVGPPKVHSYQLIRGALAAHANPGTRFCVLCDDRRPDLIATWHQVIRAVKVYDLKSRLLLLTWQELAATLPEDLQAFLLHKFAIKGT